MFLLIIVLIQCIISLSLKNNIYLSKNQWIKIKSLIINKKTNYFIRNNINNIIFRHYEMWALKKARLFKKFHKHKCQNFKLDELELYSRVGLHKATIKYNGNSSFIKYAEKYILGELYNGLTNLHSLTIFPKSYRRKNIINKKIMIPNVNPNMNTQFVSFDNYWIFDKYYNHNENNNLNDIIIYDEKIVLINFINSKLDTFSKRVFFYKYDIDFNSIRSNKIVAELMCCSEEKVRLTLKEIKCLIEPLNNNTLSRVY